MNLSRLHHGIIADSGWSGAPFRALLAAMEIPYAAIMRARNRHHDRAGAAFRSGAPVVSVGNLTVGGTGKTPLVIDLVRRLERMGFSPAVVARGYGAAPGEPNDEELLIRRRCPGVAYVPDSDRTEGCERALRECGADVIVLDDGFQHRRVARDLDIVAVDATCPFGYDRMLPRGLLREPVESLGRAGLIVVTRCDQVAATALAEVERRLRRWRDRAPIVRCRHLVTGVCRVDGDPLGDTLERRRAVVFAAIGNPRGFLTTVRSQGVEVVGEVFWGDHHRYTTGDLRGLARPGRFPPHDVLVTTEKDAVKLARLGGWESMNIRVVRVEIDFLDGGDTMVESTLHKSLAGRGEDRRQSHDATLSTR